MNRSIMETGILAKAPLLLQVALALILFQVLFWLVRPGSIAPIPLRTAHCA